MGAERLPKTSMLEAQLRELIKNKKLPNVTNFFDNRKNWQRFQNNKPQEPETLFKIYESLYRYSMKYPQELSLDEIKKIKPNVDGFKETIVECQSFKDIPEMMNFFEVGWQIQQTKFMKVYQKDFEIFLKDEGFVNKQFIKISPQQNLILNISDNIQKDQSLNVSVQKISHILGQFFRVNNLPQFGFVEKAYAKKSIENDLKKFVKHNEVSLGFKFFPLQILLGKHLNLDDKYEIILPASFDWHLCLGNVEAKNYFEPIDQEALFIDFVDIFGDKLGPKKAIKIPK